MMEATLESPIYLINRISQTVHKRNSSSILSYRGGGGGGGGGLKCIYWRQIFALAYVAVNTQNCLARMEAS